MSLALLKSDARPRPRIPAPYIPLAEAAVKLTMNPKHLARKCCDNWGPAGLAKQFGRLWGIHPNADNRLGNVETWDHRDRRQLAELARDGVSRTHLVIAETKRDILRGLDDFECDGLHGPASVDAFLARLRADEVIPCDGIKRLSHRSLYRWQAAYRDGGVAALVRRADSRAKSEPIGPAALSYIQTLVLSGNRITVGAAYKMAIGAAQQNAGDPDWRIPSYRTVLLEIGRRTPRIARELAGKGERSAKANCVPKARRDYESLDTNAEWVGDERTLDVQIRALTDRGWRHTREVKITAWMDMRSRVLVGYVTDLFADSNTILASMKIGIRNFGRPALLRVDWGHDYKKATGSPHHRRFKCKAFDGPRIAGVLDRLGIAVSPVTPYTPWAKPIESFFATMKDHLDRFFESFWGGSPVERHQDRHAWVKKNLEKLPTLDDLRAAIDAFVDTYHRSPHGAVDMFGKSPLQAHQAFIGEAGIRRESDAVLDHLFMTFAEPRLVRRDGVRFRGRWYGHGEPRLVAMQGQKVILGLSPDDASRAMVCRVDDDRTPLFEVECAPLRGFTHREAADIAKANQRVLRPYREQIRDARRIFRSGSPRQRLADYDAGVRALHGDGEPTEQAAPSLVLRPALEDAIESAEPLPNEATSKAVRTGTDDEVTIDDMLGADLVEDDSPPAGDADEIDFFGLDDCK